MKKTIEQIRNIIENFQTESSQPIEDLVKKSNILIKSCNEIAKSWSGSFVGYHGQLYFKNFYKTKHEERFSGEWGGINGIPNGWEKKEAEEVKDKIEKIISSNFSIDELEKEESELKKKAESSLHEIKIIISSLNLNNMTAEENLRLQIEKFKFGKGKNYFIANMLPSQLVSRDQEALMQGMCVPTHVYFLGVGQSIIDTCESIDIFLKLIDRFIRQLGMKKSHPFNIPQNTWNLINPFWWLWQLLLIIFKFLKFCWKHKIISVAISVSIVIMTLLAIDYSLAWKNLLCIWEWIKSLYPQNTTPNIG